MASLEPPIRQSRDALPSINNFDFDKYRMGKVDHNRFPLSSSSTLPKGTMSSPPTTYSGPPPPYSSTGSVSNTGQSMSGYISPPESSSQRSTRDKKESPRGVNLLPSISEALKSTDMAPPTQSFPPSSAPGATAGQTFGEAPKGPGNPFSQPSAPASALRSSISSMPDSNTMKTVPPPPTPPDIRQPSLLSIMGSPRLNGAQPALSGPLPSTNAPPDTPFRPSYATEATRPGYPFPDYYAQQPSLPSPSIDAFNFEHHAKIDEPRNLFVKPEPRPYNETVKRHLDVYDAELALNEIAEASSHTLEFAKVWGQRYHQANRASYFTDGLPGTTEVDETIRYAHHTLENLNRLRDVAIMQENAVNEQRARAAQGQHLDEDCHRLSEDSKSGGFAGGDAKKRRGKAAPPGRCHSCNRAETPEWRRGPDGARTLCNACGLHYAKLTRKIGAGKAAMVAGSNLRPKNLTDTRP